MSTLTSVQCWLLTAGLVLVAQAPRARAQSPVQACIQQHVEAQLLRNQDFLVAARARFSECTKPSCPAPIRHECDALGREVELELPRVILDALDEQGQSIPKTVVSIDDSPEFVPFDGRSIPLDPGSHRLRFRRPDGVMREVSVELEESESRLIRADFRSPANIEEGSPLESDGRIPTGSESARGERRWANVMLVSAGVATIAAGSFMYFALSGRSVQDHLELCRPNCTDRDDIDRMRSRYLIADVSLGTALVAVGVGAYAWMQGLAAPASRGSQNTLGMGVRLQPLATRRRIGVWATGEF